VEAAFKGHPQGNVPWVAGFPGDPYAVSGALWGGRPVLDGLPAFIKPENNNYICVSAFQAGADGVYRRRKANFAAMYTVMVDDIGTKVAPERIAMEPSVQVETSPGNAQAWYFLDPPELDPIRADLLLMRMIASGLCADARDPGMRGVTRYGRLPIGRNGKGVYVERLGKPFVQRVTRWQPDRRVPLDDLARAYGLDLTPAPKPRRKPRPLGKPDDNVLQELEALDLYAGPLAGVEGGHLIVCPWLHEHTDGDESGTAYFEPGEENSWRGGFKCHHGHCIYRGIQELVHFLRAAKRIENNSRSKA
jgi:hypothetical protein